MAPAELLARLRYEVFPLDGIVDEVAAHVPTDVKMTVTSSPRRGIEATLALAEALSARGFRVVPHLSARSISDRAHVRQMLDRLGAIGVDDVLVLGGDILEPVGEFASAYELLAAMSELGHPFAEIGIAGYPETHPFISDEATIQAMFDKEPFATYVVSQLCLDARVIMRWIARVRERGVGLPIHVGIPGVVPRRKLLRIATKIGVGESTRFVRKYGGVVGRLLLRGSVGPAHLVEGLAPHAGAIAGFHVYTFNELAATERWRQEILARLGRVAA